MAIATHNELTRGDVRTESAASELTRVFRVRVDAVSSGSADINPLLVKNDSRTPKPGDAHPVDPAFTCRETNVQYETEDDRLTLLAISRYETGAPPDFPTNPWEQPVEVGGSFNITSVEVSKTWVKNRTTGVFEFKTLRNAAGMQFDPRHVKDEADPSITLLKRYAPGAFNLTTLVSFRNAINDTDWTVPEMNVVIPAGTARILNAPWTLKYHNQDKYVEVTFEILVREDGWVEAIPDAGMEIKSGTAVPPCTVAITHANGEPVTSPVFLNLDGTQPLNCNEEPNFVEVLDYPLKNFSLLGI